MTHRILITPSRDSNKAPRHNSRGALYDVSYEGHVIVTDSTEPCLAACRALKAMGITGRLEMWDDVLPYVRLTADIDKAASLTVEEGDRLPRLRTYRSYRGGDAQDGDLVAGGYLTPLNAEMPSLEAEFEPLGVVAARVFDKLMASQQQEAA